MQVEYTVQFLRETPVSIQQQMVSFLYFLDFEPLRSFQIIFCLPGCTLKQVIQNLNSRYLDPTYTRLNIITLQLTSTLQQFTIHCISNNEMALNQGTIIKHFNNMNTQNPFTKSSEGFNSALPQAKGIHLKKKKNVSVFFKSSQKRSKVRVWDLGLCEWC